jgi:hypothetical protein
MRELHIAEEVVLLSNYIKSRILSANNNRGSFSVTHDYYKRYLCYKCGYKKYDKFLFFNEIKVYYFINDYTNDDEMMESKNSSTNVKVSTFIEYIILRLHLIRINGVPDPGNFDEVIQHEVNHAYQIFLKDKKTSFINKDKSPVSKKTLNKWFRVYEIAKNNINSDNIYIKKLSNIFYYLDEKEQDGYVNGLFSNLINSKRIDNINLFLSNTRQYITLNYLKEIQSDFDNWEKDNIQVIEAKNLFFSENTSFDNFIRSIKGYTNEGIKRYSNKLAGVVTKFKNEQKITLESQIKDINKRLNLLERYIILLK